MSGFDGTPFNRPTHMLTRNARDGIILPLTLHGEGNTGVKDSNKALGRNWSTRGVSNEEDEILPVAIPIATPIYDNSISEAQVLEVWN